MAVFDNKIKICDLIKVKAEVLCWGLKFSRAADEIYLSQHPTVHKRTGNAGIHMVLEDKLVLNAIYGERFCQFSPWSIEKINKQFWLFKNKKPACKFSVIKAPKWYLKKTSDGVYMADVLLQEGLDTLTAAVWNNCCYFKNRTECQFCILGNERGGIEWKKVGQIVEVVAEALKENPDYYLHFTGGNTTTPDHGINYYKKYVEAVRKKYKNLPISLEISPPDDIKDLERIINAGVNGFSINIEVWNEAKRQKICPGKSRIKRNKYFKAWKKGVKKLGKFKISSVIIVGLNTKREVIKGIKELVQLGVKPVLLPFRPFDKNALNHLKPPNPSELLELSAVAGAELKEAQADQKEFIGCEHCGACTIENDNLRYLKI